MSIDDVDLSRRQMLVRGAAVAGVTLYATPVVQVITMSSASAATASGLPGGGSGPGGNGNLPGDNSSPPGDNSKPPGDNGNPPGKGDQPDNRPVVSDDQLGADDSCHNGTSGIVRSNHRPDLICETPQGVGILPEQLGQGGTGTPGDAGAGDKARGTRVLASDTSRASALPFTGAELGMVAGAAAASIAAGAGALAAGRRRPATVVEPAEPSRQDIAEQ